MSNPGTPETGALSIDQAVTALDLPRKEPAAPDAPAPEPAAADAITDVTPQDGGEPQQDADTEAQADSGDAPDLPAIDAPKFWDAKARERFGELPRDVQEIILRKEDERTAYVSRQAQEAAQKRNAAETETARLKALNDGLDVLIPHAATMFQDRWANVDWNKVVDQYGADQALKLQNQMQAEQRQLQHLSTAKEEASRLNLTRFVQEQEAMLPTLAPDLADPKAGPARKAELGRFLVESGIPAERIPYLSATEASLAYDAMQWRNGQAKAKALINAPKNQPAARKTPVKPTGTGPQGSPQQNRLSALNRKRELTIDEAVELANLKGSQAA